MVQSAEKMQQDRDERIAEYARWQTATIIYIIGGIVDFFSWLSWMQPFGKTEYLTPVEAGITIARDIPFGFEIVLSLIYSVAWPIHYVYFAWTWAA
jgi:hypothetical protein